MTNPNLAQILVAVWIWLRIMVPVAITIVQTARRNE
jgi:hypothetical protein